MSRQQSACAGELNLILETMPRLDADQVVIPLEILSFLLLSRSLYATSKQTNIWRREVELFLRLLTIPNFKYGDSLEELDSELRNLAEFVLRNSLLKAYGLYGAELADPEKIEALLKVKSSPIVRSSEAKYAGATSLAQTLKSFKTKSDTLADSDIRKAKFYPTDAEAVALGRVLTHLCRLARNGVPDSLHNFEKKRDVVGVVWDCFEGVYTRATVQVDREFLGAILNAFMMRSVRLDYVLFLPLYQAVYARDKSFADLQLSVGTWLSMFGAQGSETSYKPHIYGQHIERNGEGRFYPLGEKYPFFLCSLGVDHNKYSGIYLCLKEPGQFVIGENSFSPSNFPVRAFVLGEELRGIERDFYPSLSPKYRGAAFNQLVCPNPITKTNLKVDSSTTSSKLENEFTALIRGVKECQGQCSKTLLSLGLDAAKHWAQNKDKKYLFRNFTEFEAIKSNLENGTQLPEHLKFPLEKVESENDREAWNQKYTPQKEVDSLLNIFSQSVLVEINNKLGGIFSGYLPGTSPLHLAGQLSEVIRKNKHFRIMNVDVAKAFNSIDLVAFKDQYDNWLKECDLVARKYCSREQADFLKNIFLSFVERVRSGFYAGKGVDPGKTPLGLSLGPSFWVYLSLPLADALFAAKDKGDCLLATITGDDTLAVLRPEANKDELWKRYFEFSKLGFRYHFFKNFELSFGRDIAISTEGAFSDLWDKNVPVIHAGIMVHRSLIYATSKLRHFTEEDLAKQAKFGLLRFPTNILRLYEHQKLIGLSVSDAKFDNDGTCDTLVNSIDRVEQIRALEPTTHGGLIYLNKGRLLKQILASEEDEEVQVNRRVKTTPELRQEAAVNYQSFFQRTVKGKDVDSEVLAEGLKEEILKGFPGVRNKKDIQPMFGDCEAVVLQVLMDICPGYKFQSNHGRKIRIAVGRAKCHDYNHASYYSKTLVVPLTRLALENPDQIFTKRQRSLVAEGTTLGPRFSVKKDDDTFKRSGQALAVLAVDGGEVKAPLIYEEILTALCVMTRQRIDWTRTQSQKSLQAKILELFETLSSSDKICFRSLLRGHLRRCRDGEKTFRQEIKKVLNGKDLAWETAHKSWKDNELVKRLLKS